VSKWRFPIAEAPVSGKAAAERTRNEFVIDQTLNRKQRLLQEAVARIVVDQDAAEMSKGKVFFIQGMPGTGKRTASRPLAPPWKTSSENAL
jgi:ABC-type proline/glycine betaine transport system ATPase subunit